MSMFVEELGGSAVTAHDGASGLAALESFHPDIVFMDIGMPGLDGYEVCRRIRQMPSHRHVVLVAVTGWGQAQDKRRALDVGLRRPPHQAGRSRRAGAAPRRRHRVEAHLQVRLQAGLKARLYVREL